MATKFRSVVGNSRIWASELELEQETIISGSCNNSLDSVIGNSFRKSLLVFIHFRIVKPMFHLGIVSKFYF